MHRVKKLAGENHLFRCVAHADKLHFVNRRLGMLWWAYNGCLIVSSNLNGITMSDTIMYCEADS